MFLGTSRFGSRCAGWFGEHLGPRVAFAGGGLVALANGLVGLWVLSRRASAGRLELDPAGIGRVEAA